MKMRKIFIVPLVLLGLSRPALADDKCQLVRLVSVQMEWEAQYNRWIVPITIQGTPEKLLLDTGGAVMQLSEETVQALGLHERDSNLELYDVAGHKSNKKVLAKDVTFGSVKGDIDFQVAPLNVPGVAGIFVASQLYDVDLDFGAGKLNFFSPDHCTGQVLYWPHQAVAAVPFRIADGHIRLAALVNGKTLPAILDTGAAITTLNAEDAKRAFDLTSKSPGMTFSGNVNSDPSLPAYSYVLDSLGFEGVSINHAQVLIFQDQTRKGGDQRKETGSLIRTYADDIEIEPVTIGMNVLKHLHIYFAFKEHMAYITKADDVAPESGEVQALPDAPGAK